MLSAGEGPSYASDDTLRKVNRPDRGGRLSFVQNIKKEDRGGRSAFLVQTESGGRKRYQDRLSQHENETVIPKTSWGKAAFGRKVSEKQGRAVRNFHDPSYGYAGRALEIFPADRAIRKKRSGLFKYRGRYYGAFPEDDPPGKVRRGRGGRTERQSGTCRRGPENRHPTGKLPAAPVPVPRGALVPFQWSYGLTPSYTLPLYGFPPVMAGPLGSVSPSGRQVWPYVMMPGMYPPDIFPIW